MASLERPACVVVTGANKGFGKAVCLSLAKVLKPRSVMFVLGRKVQALDDCIAEIGKVNEAVSVFAYSRYDCDHLDHDDLEQFIVNSFVGNKELTPPVKDLVVIHNAASLGDLSRPSNVLTATESTDYMRINLSAMIQTNTTILNCLDFLPNKTLIQVSSLLAVKPLKSMALYCSGKAARDMYFQVFAEENPAIRVLNYAPGPLSTDMFNSVKQTTHSEDVRKSFRETTPLTPAESADKLVLILERNDFSSGQHVDFYDV